MILTATSGSSSITLSDGAPFGLLSARGMGGAEIRRVTQQGPAQDGDTDTGYRLAPREIELVIGFQGSSDSVLDGYRDTLTSFFKPLTATPVKLRMTRDDGAVRQIDCNVVGSVKIDLLPMYRPGHYHRATIRLRAPDPAWYNPTPGTVSFAGTVPSSLNWWLAEGVVGTAQVLMHGGTPSANEVWSYAGTIGTATGYTLAVRAEYVSYLHSNMYMFDAPSLPLEPVARFGVAGTETYGTTSPYYAVGPSPAIIGNLMNSGTLNYFFNADPNGATINGVSNGLAQTLWLLQYGTYSYQYTKSYLIGTAQKWRTNSWPGTVQLYALYSPPLTEGQRNAVSAYMTGITGTAIAGTINQILPLPYSGDLPEYPVISLTGPITNPSITNVVTGEVLNFGTITIGAGVTYVIDTRHGYKTVTQGTVNRIDQLSDNSDLSTWHLVPSPIASGGTNTIFVAGTAIGTATSIQVVYYNRYMSF